MLEEDIAGIVELIWKSVLRLSIEPLPVLPWGPERTKTLMGCVQISGEWQGVVVLHCPVELAQRAAKIMFSLGDNHPELEDTLDAFREITNMTGGNIKALLPGPCALSLPVVVEGENYSLQIAGTSPVARQSFRCLGFPFTVSVLREQGASERRKVVLDVMLTSR
jgi:CheY-specific phosphatase CheX